LQIITLSKSTAHTSLFSNEKILPVEKLILYQKACIMHSIIYEYSPSPLLELFEKNQAHVDHNLREYNSFKIPRPRTEQFKKFPQHSLPTVWNSLEEAKLYNNRVTFQTALKHKLLEQLLNN